MKTTKGVEKLELKITGIMQEIESLQRKIASLETIKKFSGTRPGELKKCLAKMTEAYRALYDAVGHLVGSGNDPKKLQKDLPLL